MAGFFLFLIRYKYFFVYDYNQMHAGYKVSFEEINH